MSVDCIITAAGLSSRMGKWKMMLPLRDGTILDASIENALQFCSRIILVTGYRAEALQARYRHQESVTLVHNPDYEKGMLGSVIAGARAVKTEYCFITTGDLPCLHGDVYRSCGRYVPRGRSCRTIRARRVTLFWLIKTACSRPLPGRLSALCARR